MIITMSDDKKNVASINLVANGDKRKEIERLHSLYSTPNFELGYLQHGMLFFHQEKPEHVLVTEKNIQVFDSYKWGENGIETRGGNLYPVEYYTTRAKHTLNVIRQLLGLEHEKNIVLKDFFSDSSKEVHEQGFLIDTEPDVSLLSKKLEYILANKEIALSLLKDAYLDFDLFVDLLTKVELETRIMQDPELFEFLHAEALENTQILDSAKAFAKLKQR